MKTTNLRRMEGASEFCAGCGCTEDNPCEGGCWWIEPGLCSACEDKPTEQWPRLAMTGFRFKTAKNWVIMPTIDDAKVAFEEILLLESAGKSSAIEWLIEVKPFRLTAEEYYSLPIEK